MLLSHVRFWFSAAVVMALVGCGDEPTVPRSSHVIQRALAHPGDLSNAERASAEFVARALALGLSDRNARNYLMAALASSSNREGKLYLSSFIEGRGGALLAGVQAKGIGTEQLREAISRLRPVEFYMPVAAHRAAWTGDRAPLVAFALREGDTPVAYDSVGQRILLSRQSAPNLPVVAITPLETDLRAQDDLNRRGEAERACSAPSGETLAELMRKCDGQGVAGRLRTDDQAVSFAFCYSYPVSQNCKPGLYLRELHLQGVDVESWLAGSPEYQIHVYAPKQGNPPGTISDWQCSGEGLSLNAGYPYDAFHWDMNGTHWASRAQLLYGTQLDAMRAISPAMSIQLWEDDGDFCMNRHAAVALSTIIRGAAWASLPPLLGDTENWDPSGWEGFMINWAAVAVWMGWGALVDLAEGGDDPIGVFMKKEASPFTTSPTANMVLVGANAYRGWARIAWEGTGGPSTQPVSSVAIMDSAPKIQLGYTRQLSGVAYDAAGFGLPAATIAWSSSNSSVASVNASGVVSGNAIGTATITASVGSITGTKVVQVLAVGLPVTLSIQPSSVSLAQGSGAQLYARFYDTNGFEVPIESGTVWTSADNGVCSMSGTGYVTGLSGGTTTVTATNDGFTTNAVCYVSYGGGVRISSEFGTGVTRREGTKTKRKK